MRFIFTMFAIIFTLMSFVELLSVSSAVFLFRIINLAALFCWGAVVKLSLPPGVYNHQLYDKMIEIPAVQSEMAETSDSSSESSLEAAI